MDWLNIQKSINYIEDNIFDNLNHDKIAKQMYLSSFHFHRAFSMITGITIGEYIRNRKLSLAGQELFITKAKVIDIASKYGYESPESFTKAFTRFHGVNPSEAKISSANLKFFNPLTININLKGGFNMANLEKFEIKRFGPYRFIGKSVYARGGSGDIFGGLWGNSDWIFKKLDNLKGYSTDEIHDVALITTDKYDEQKKLIGYTVGRFMKADTPVPEGMDYFDISDMFMAQGFVSGKFDDMIANAERMTAEAIEKQTKYVATWEFFAEIYTKDTIPDADVSSVLGYYISCKEKE